MSERISILMVLIIIFLLIIVYLVMNLGGQLLLQNRLNTFCGGDIRPSLLVNPITFSKNNIISIYRQGEYSDKNDEKTLGLSQNSFTSLISFINPGNAIYKGKEFPVVRIKLRDNESAIITCPIINLSNGEKGLIDHNILYDVINETWGDYHIDIKNFFEPISQSLKVITRPQIFYESLLDAKGRKIITIGDFSIDITNGFSPSDKFIFDTLATSMMDFVYLGEFNVEKRIEFLKKFGGKEAVDYYYKWYKDEAAEDRISPLVKYKKAREEYIAYYLNKNITPPQWVKEEFLYKIGVNLKIDKKTNINELK